MRSNGTCPTCGRTGTTEPIEGLCPHCLATVAFASEKSVEAATCRPALMGASVFGEYELIEEIARGGNGVVYKAYQRSLNRIVAVKMLLLGRRGDDRFVRRFRAEAESAAVLQHPNIVRIHECGEHAGHSYYSMEYVEGQNLAERARDARLPPELAADYVRTIAEAVHHAHQRGILHRDLKPSNILIDALDRPHVTDFGLAKRLHQGNDLTLTGQVLGTPNFMSPEQARGRREEVTVAGDIYSLGAILYQLLSGRPPFLSESVETTLHRLLNEPPAPPHRFCAAIPRELETICLKCLEKEPGRRYPTAQTLAEDLGRWLRGEPILAHPAGAAVRFWAWCRRKPALAASLALGLLLMVVVVGGSAIMSWRIERARRAEHAERERAVHANLQLSETITRLELQRAEDRFESGDTSMALASLARVLRGNPTNQVVAQRMFSALLQRDFAMPAAPPIRHGGAVLRVEFSPDGGRLLSLSADPFVKVWDIRTGRLLLPPLQHDDRVLAAHFSPEGQRVATGSADRTARVWDARTGGSVGSPLAHGGEVRNLAFSPNGDRLATGSGEGRVRVWDVRLGKLLAEFSGHGGPVRSLQFSPKGEWILSDAEDGTICLWNSHTGQPVQPSVIPPTRLLAARFAPDPLTIAAVLQDRTVLFNLPASPAMEFPTGGSGPMGDCEWATISPDSRFVATISRDRRARLWTVNDGRSVADALAHEAEVNFARFSPDGRRLVTVSSDNSARLWETSTGRLLCQPMRQRERLVAADFAPDGGLLAIGGYAGVIQVYNVRFREASSSTLAHPLIRHAEFSPDDGRLVATAGDDRTVRVWNALTGLPAVPPLPHPDTVATVRFSPDAQVLATVSADGVAHLWNAGTGRVLGTLHHGAGLRDARFSEDSALLVTFGGHDRALFWDARTGKPARSSPEHPSPVMEARISPDGTRAVIACRDGSVWIHDLNSGNTILRFQAHPEPIHGIALNRVGNRVATASEDNTARVWDLETGLAVTPPLRHTRTVAFAEFSPDGGTVATGSLDNTARLWNAETGEPMGEPMRHADRIWSIAFSPEGRRVLTASRDHSARIWDARLGLPLGDWLVHGSDVRSAQWSPDGERVLTASRDGTARIWATPRLDLPIPDWLPELAEVAAGLRFNVRKSPELVTWEDVEGLRARVEAAAGKDRATADSPERPSAAAVTGDGEEHSVRIARRLLADRP